jgi:hypothetical protein
LVLVAAGLSAVAAGWAWRHRATRRHLAGICADLGSGRTEERIRAGECIVQNGLSVAARHILPHMRTERDRRVRSSIALAVARRQWEPNHSPAVAELRRWAANELRLGGYDIVEFGPAFARMSDMFGPSREVARPAPQAEPAKPAPSPAAEPSPQTAPSARPPTMVDPDIASLIASALRP